MVPTLAWTGSLCLVLSGAIKALFRKYFLGFCGLGWTEFSTRLFFFFPATLALKKMLLKAPHLLQTFLGALAGASCLIARIPTEEPSPGPSLGRSFTESSGPRCQCGNSFSHTAG